MTSTNQEPPLNSEDLNYLVHTLNAIREGLQTTTRMLRRLAPLHMTFSEVTDSVVTDTLCFRCHPMTLLEDKREEMEALGLKEAETEGEKSISIADLRRSITASRRLGPGPGLGEALRVSFILLRLASIMTTVAAHVTLLPGYAIPNTTVSGHSFSGIAGYIVSRAPPAYDASRGDPIGESAEQENRVSIVMEAKGRDLRVVFPQAVVAAASYCVMHKLPVIRGCATNGEEWLFFVYDRRGDVAVIQEPISLGANMERLPLVLGLLQDMLEHSKEYCQRFFRIEVS